MHYFSVSHATVQLGGIHILRDLSFHLEEAQITGLIGPNGAGKSTLFNVISGIIPAGGSVRFRGQELLGRSPHHISGLGITRTFQDAKVFPQMSVLENLMSASPLLRGICLADVFFRSRETRQRQQAAQEKALSLLRHVNLESKAHVRAEDLSYGQTKLAELLKVFMSDAELIFLDEPFSGLFSEMIELVKKLIYELIRERRSVVLVEHNMKLIEEVCGRVVVLDYGRKIAEGSFAEVKKNPEVLEAYLGF